MNLQATATDARLAAYAPFADRQGGTSLVRISGVAYAVTVQLPQTMISPHSQHVWIKRHDCDMAYCRNRIQKMDRNTEASSMM